MKATVESVAAVIRAHRFRYANEEQLQQGLAAAIANAGFPVEREVRLDRRCRIDLLVDGTVGVEVKVAGRVADVARQIDRYLAFDRLSGLVLVTGRVRHLRLEHDGWPKPLLVVELAGAGL